MFPPGIQVKVSTVPRGVARQVGQGGGVTCGGVHAHVEVQNFHIIEPLLVKQHVALFVFNGQSHGPALREGADIQLSGDFSFLTHQGINAGSVVFGRVRIVVQGCFVCAAGYIRFAILHIDAQTIRGLEGIGVPLVVSCFTLYDDGDSC